MENEELLRLWHTLNGYCADRRREGTGKGCILYGVCTHRDCVPAEHPLSRKINRAMLTGAPVAYDGMKFDYICGYSKCCDRRHGNLNEPYMVVELMDENANSIVRVSPEKIVFLDEPDIPDAETCVSCGGGIPGRCSSLKGTTQICPNCKAKAGLSS